MVSPVVPFADPLSCVLLPRGMIGPWFHFGELCLIPKRSGQEVEPQTKAQNTNISRYIYPKRTKQKNVQYIRVAIFHILVYHLLIADVVHHLDLYQNGDAI